MSEARALTNFAGNAVATVLIGHWTGELDRDQADRGARRRHCPFDEATMLDDDEVAGTASTVTDAEAGTRAPDRALAEAH